MNIYLDIDGVLLANSKQATLFADDFIIYILGRWPDSTYWLTTHCWRGENRTLELLKPVLKPATFQRIKQIKPTVWDRLKTDALDYNQPFLWFDDDLFSEERAELLAVDALDCWREINLTKNPYQLLDEVAFLKSLAH